MIGGIGGGNGPPWGEVFKSFAAGLAGGLTTLGVQKVLEPIDIYPQANNFIANYLGQLVTNQIAGGSGSGSGDPEEEGENILSKIGDGIKKFASGIINAVGTVIDFGAKVLGGAAQITVESFKGAIGAFSSIFSRQTQEALYSEETGLTQGDVTVDGDIWHWQNGAVGVSYNTATGEVNETFGIGGEASIAGLGMDEEGNYFFGSLTYENVINEGATLRQTYENNQLTEWSYDVEGTTMITISCPDDLSGEPWITDDGVINSAQIELPNMPILIEVPDDLDTPEYEADSFILPFFFSFTVLGGEIAEGTAKLLNKSYYSPGTGTGTVPEEDRDLFVLVNGILNEEFEGAPDCIYNMRDDIVNQSDNKVMQEDIILAPTFFKSICLALANGTFTLTSLLNPANLNPITFMLSTVLGPLVEEMLNCGKDVLSLVLENIDPITQAQAAGEIQASMEAYFAIKGDEDRAREIVAVAHSGGFWPLAEVLKNNPYDADADTGYNAKGLVGLGAANFKLSELAQTLVDKFAFVLEIIEKLDTTSVAILDNIEIELVKLIDIATALNLTGIGGNIVQTTMDLLRQGLFVSGHANILEEAKNMISQLTTAEPVDITQANLNVLVNVYGTKDYLAKDFLIEGFQVTGYRDEIGGYSIYDEFKPLVNIEIVGATHSEYMRNDISFGDWGVGLLGTVADWASALFSTEDREWNRTVANFVADLVTRSKTLDEVVAFLDEAKTTHSAQIEQVDGKWIVKLPGWEERE